MTTATRGRKPKNKTSQRELVPAPTGAPPDEAPVETAMVGGPDGISIPLIQTDEVRTVVQDEWQPDRTNPEYADYGRAVLVQTVEGEVRSGTVHRTLNAHLDHPLYEIDYGPLPEGAVGGPGHDIRRLAANDDMVFVDDLHGPASSGPLELEQAAPAQVDQQPEADDTVLAAGAMDHDEPSDDVDPTSELRGAQEAEAAEALSPQTEAALQDATMARLRTTLTDLLRANGGRIPSNQPELGKLLDEGFAREEVMQALKEVASFKKGEGGEVGRWTLPGTPPPPPAAMTDDAAVPAEHKVGDRRLTPDGMEHTVSAVRDRFVASQCGATFLPPRNITKKGDCPNCSTDGKVKPAPAAIEPPPSSGRAQRAGQASSAAVQTGSSTRGRGRGRGATPTPSAPAAPKATADKPAAAPKADNATAGNYTVVPVEGGFVVQDGAGTRRTEVFPKSEDARWWGQRLTKLARVKGDLYMPKVPNTTPEGYTIETAGEGQAMTAWLSKDGKRLPPTFATGTNCRVDAMRYSQRLGRPGRAG